MRPILLGVTRDLHESRVIDLRGTLNRATVLIGILIVAPVCLWVAHAISLIPSFFPRLIPEEVVASVAAIEDTVDGASGFMVDSRHFLTTERALKGDTGSVAEGEAAQVSFSDSEGKANGSVAWISESNAGTRLVLLRMDDTRLDAMLPASSPLEDGGRFLVAGFRLDATDGKSKLSQGSFILNLFEDALGSADWGDADPPPFEGAPVVVKSGEGEYSALGIMTQGSLVIKIPVDDLQQVGAGF